MDNQLNTKKRLEVLDGWRGISISLVLAGHLLPIGLKEWKMNFAVAATGMVIFFILSGFLITNMLLNNQNIKIFLIKRVMRIFPLAWLVLGITLLFEDASLHQWLSNFLFYANWVPIGLTNTTSHYWSLCIEVQFYFFIAISVLIFKRNALFFIPFLCLMVTMNRVYNDTHIAINTYYRLDEILAGGMLALLYNSNLIKLKAFIGKLNPYLFFVLLFASAHSYLESLNYFRPYIAMLLVASTLFADFNSNFIKFLKNKMLRYLASTSFALYIIHGVLTHTWLGSGDKIIKYIKRPLLFATTFFLAHISTQYYEKYWINLGYNMTKKMKT